MTVKTFNGIAAASVKAFNGVAAASIKTWNGEPWPAAGFPFANVKALLHFDGTDASTTFTDVIGHTFTARGDAQIDTAQSKFGGASGLFDGTGDYIDTPDSTDWNFGTSDFTIECWVRFNSVAAGLKGIAGQCNSAGSIATTSFQLYHNGSSTFDAFVGQGSSPKGNLTTSGVAPATGQWYHVAYVRNGNRFDLYIDGTSRANVTESATVNDSASKLAIGRLGDSTGTNPLNGWIDDFRIVIGSAVYTANFTPPTAAFPDS